MKRVAIYGNNYQDGYHEALGSLMSYLSEEGFEVILYAPFALYLQKSGVAIPGSFGIAETLDDSIECVITLGGDGTFLRAAQWVADRNIPIAGINTGHLGYLASYSIDAPQELVYDLRHGTGSIECRAVLRVESPALPAGFWPYAVNEVSVQKGETASMVTVHTEIDGDFLADYMADGLLISTPTGSTAYNLSVGGPILQPTLRCMVISPVAPHSLTMRPLVVSGDSEIRITTHSRVRTSRVSLDGRSFMLNCETDELRITRADFQVHVVRRSDANFSRLLRTKLHWGV